MQSNKGGIEMIAKLWAEWIANKKRTYKQVPSGLKESVKNILIEWGYTDLIIE